MAAVNFATENDYEPPADVAALNAASLSEVRASWKECGLTPSDVDQIVSAWMRAASLRIRSGLPVTLEYIGRVEPRIVNGDMSLIRFSADEGLFDVLSSREGAR